MRRSDTSLAITDPRVTRSKAKVLQVTRELLGERGLAGTSIDAIVQRSGVARTTIYRHWPRRVDVIREAVEATIDQPGGPVRDSLRADLCGLVGGLCDALSEGPWAGLLPALMEAPERDPELAELHRRFTTARADAIREAVDRGIALGDLPEEVDADEVVDLLVGAVFHRRVLAGDRLDRAYAERIVDRVLAAYG